MTTLPRDVVTIDFETEAIGPRPHEYPPKPVGVAIRTNTGSTRYLAWGHLHNDNNCTFERARAELWYYWQHPCLFHNAAFDLEVAHKWMGFPAPKEWHDTYYCLFLCYPHVSTYSLKPTATWLLSEPPDEQNALHDWIIANVPGATKKNAGAYICKAPVSLVEPYAIGDVERTHAIFALLWPHVQQRMLAPYQRERALMPMLVNASKRGIRVERGYLSIWQGQFDKALREADMRLRTGKYMEGNVGLGDINLDSNDELADALERAGYVTDAMWPRTATGKRSVTKKVLESALAGFPAVRDLLIYRNTVGTYLRTFIEPWEQASSVDGRLHCQWHQVKQEEGGARTGRIASSNPNLANVPNPSNIVTPWNMPALPNLRTALLPEEGHVWVSADYNSQELRDLAHFENGELMQAYRDNPRLDLHERGRLLAYNATHLPLLATKESGRKPTKIVNFSAIYGAGLDNLQGQLGLSKDETLQLRDAIFAAMGGMKALRDRATHRWRSGQKIRTWGGREVPCQPPATVKGKRYTFEYKALNMLIQGSAADQTKEAIVRLGRFTSVLLLSQLYDEINVSVPEEDVPGGFYALNESMVNMPGWDVPFLIDVEVGNSWGNLRPL